MNSFYLAITFFIVLLLGFFNVLEFQKITLFGFSLAGYLATNIDIMEAFKKELRKEYTEEEINKYLNENTFASKIFTCFHKNVKYIQEFTLIMIFDISIKKKKYDYAFYYIIIAVALVIIAVSVALIFDFNSLIFYISMIVFVFGNILSIKFENIINVLKYSCTFFILVPPLMKDSLMKFNQDYIMNQLVILTLVGIFLLLHSRSRSE